MITMLTIYGVNDLNQYLLLLHMLNYSFITFVTLVVISTTTSALRMMSAEFHMPKAKGIHQQQYVQHLDNTDHKLIIVAGPAGTGKTLFACAKAISLLKTGELSKIVITRPLVTVDEDLGFLPGNIEQKTDPWTRPIFDIFLEHYSRKELDSMLFDNTIEISPLAFMRGRTFKNTFIIADEMQNSTPSQMQMLATRLGKGSRLVIAGDLLQSDRGDNNGLKDIVERTNEFYNDNPSIYHMINVVLFDNDDVQRSKLVKHVLDIYTKYPTKHTITQYRGVAVPRTIDDIVSYHR